MHISKISTNILTFKQNDYENRGFSVYDDEEERPSIFDYLRRSFEADYMPYYKYQGQKEDVEVMLAKLTSQSTVSDQGLADVKAKNFRKIGENVYAGATLYNSPSDLKHLKEAGIERIVDLVGIDKYKDACLAAGLEYYSFPLFCNNLQVWEHPIFKDKNKYVVDEYLKRSSDPRVDIKGDMLREKILFEYDDKIEDFKTQFCKFMNVMRKGNLYVGCGFGVNSTSNALKLDYIFNSKRNYIEEFSLTPSEITSMRALYKNLTPKDKIAFGINEDFDMEIRKNLGLV